MHCAKLRKDFGHVHHSVRIVWKKSLNNMDTRTIIAFALMILIYMFFFQPTRPIPENAAVTNTVQMAENIAEVKKNPAPQINGLRKKRLVLTNGKVRVEVDELGSVYQSEFTKYNKDVQKSGRVALAFNSLAFNETLLETSAGSPNWKNESSSESEVRLISAQPDLTIRRTISLLPDSYILSFSDSIQNSGKKTAKVNFKIQLSYPPVFEKSPTGFFEKIFHPQAEIHEFIYDIDGAISRVPFQKIGEPVEKLGLVSWGGFAEKYFFYGIVPKNISGTGLNYRKAGDGSVIATLSLTEKIIPPGEMTDCSYEYYLGPKEIPQLVKTSPDVKEVVDYGSWLGPISRLLLSILHAFYRVIPNYGVGIILLTILVKLALFPLAYKSAVAMRKLQLVQPKMKDLRDKYKDDKQRLNAEMMNLYRTEKVNPVGGCLPMLVQMPVFFALYRVFFASIEFRHSPFFGWIRDLASYDPYFVTPILMTALMWYQTKLTPQPPAMDENETVQAQRAMMKWMPILFGAIMIFLPSGLTLYFLVNALISLVQQLYLNKKLGVSVSPASGQVVVIK
jgi:YidC/Oxa1 family membrane protein insertase